MRNACAYLLLCMLAYYSESLVRQALALILFDDHQQAQAVATRSSVVAPAQRLRPGAPQRRPHVHGRSFDAAFPG